MQEDLSGMFSSEVLREVHCSHFELVEVVSYKEMTQFYCVPFGIVFSQSDDKTIIFLTTSVEKSIDTVINYV